MVLAEEHRPVDRRGDRDTATITETTGNGKAPQINRERRGFFPINGVQTVYD